MIVDAYTAASFASNCLSIGEQAVSNFPRFSSINKGLGRSQGKLPAGNYLAAVLASVRAKLGGGYLQLTTRVTAKNGAYLKPWSLKLWGAEMRIIKAAGSVLSVAGVLLTSTALRAQTSGSQDAAKMDLARTNEKIVREFYDARMSRDRARLESTIDRLFADEVVWHYPGRNPLAQDYKGKEGVKTFFRSLGEITKGAFRVDLDDVVASDKNVVALELPQAERKGDKYNWYASLHYRLQGGKIREVRVYQHTQYDLDDFWAELAQKK